MEIRAAWTHLREERPGGSPCLHWHWFDRFWSEMLPPQAEVAIITSWSGETLLGAAPVVISPERAGLGLHSITGMENAHSAFYEWLLSADGDAAGRAASEIASALVEVTARRGIVSWRNAPESPATHIARRALAATSWRVVWRPQRPHRVIHFPNGAESLLASLSANMRARLRKSGRRVEQMGEVRFRQLSREADLGDWLRAAWELEGCGWKGRAGTSVNQDERARKFYDSLAVCLVPENRFALFALTCGDRLVSFLYGLVEDKRLYGLKFSYDLDFARSSPGHLIILRIIEWAETRGISSLDLGGDSEFKAHWSGTLEPLGSVYGFPRGIRGAAAMAALASGAATRRLTKKRRG